MVSKSTSGVSSPFRTSTNRVDPARPGVRPGKTDRRRETIPCTGSKLEPGAIDNRTACGALSDDTVYWPAGKPPMRYSPRSSVSASYVGAVVDASSIFRAITRAPIAGMPCSTTRPDIAAPRGSRMSSSRGGIVRRSGSITEEAYPALVITIAEDTWAARSRSVRLRR